MLSSRTRCEINESPVSASNSLVGTNAGDFVGFTGWNFLASTSLPSLTSAAIYQTLFAQHGGTGDAVADLGHFGINSGTSILFGQVKVLSQLAAPGAG